MELNQPKIHKHNNFWTDEDKRKVSKDHLQEVGGPGIDGWRHVRSRKTPVWPNKALPVMWHHPVGFSQKRCVVRQNDRIYVGQLLGNPMHVAQLNHSIGSSVRVECGRIPVTWLFQSAFLWRMVRNIRALMRNLHVTGIRDRRINWLRHLRCQTSSCRRFRKFTRF